MITSASLTTQVTHKGKTRTVATLRCTICRKIVLVATAPESEYTLTQVPCGAGDLGMRGKAGWEPTHTKCIGDAGGYVS